MKDYTAVGLLFLMFLLVGVRSVDSAVVTETTPLNQTNVTTPMSLKQVEKTVESFVTSITKMLLPYFVRNSDLNLSPQCMSTIIKMFVSIRKLKVSAIKLLDAFAKPPFGLLHGSFAIMGDYDECLSVSVNKKGDVASSPEEELYHGQYCTVEIKMPQTIVDGMKEYGHGRINITEFGKLGKFVEEFPTTIFADKYFDFNAGFCVPSTCSQKDLQEMIKLVPVSFISTKVKRCESNVPKTVTTDQVIILSILAVVAALVVIGTAFEGIIHLTHIGENKSKWRPFFLSFSVYNNTKKLLAPEKGPSGEIHCINGMYVLGTFLVIIYHTYFLPFFVYFSSKVANMGHFLNDPKFTLVSTMGVSIEAYFLFSGLFLVYGRFKRGGNNVEVNVIKLIVRRYLRLAPSVLLILGIIIVLPLVGSGPVWADIFDVAAERSKEWWWTYALMYNNFLAIKDQNFLYLWFIPCLLQISIVGAIFLWVLSKCRKLGITLIVLSALACNLTLSVLTALRHYPPSYAVYYFHNRENFEHTIYTSPLSHVTSFSIGMLLGYYMSQNPTIKWSKAHVVIGWIVSFVLTVGTQYVLYIGHQGRDPDPVFSAAYAAVHKTLFSLGIAWVILACTHGYGGVLAKILNWKAFGPLSKLGYLAYLVHYLVIAYDSSTARVVRPFVHSEVWYRITSYVTLTFIFAYVLYITFELPLNFLESLILPRRHDSSASSDHQRAKSKDQDFIRFTPGTDEHTKSLNFRNNLCVVPTNIVIFDEHSKL